MPVKNVGYMYDRASARGQRGNSSRANPRTGQRRLTQDRFALFVFRLSAFEHDKSASARGFVWLPFDNAGRINRKLLSLCRTTVNSAVHVAYIYVAHIRTPKFYGARIICRYKKKTHIFAARSVRVSNFDNEIITSDSGVRAVSNYRDINAGREFDRHFRETSLSRGYPAASDPSPCIREAATYARVYVRGILCVMHTCMIRERMLKTRVACARVYP